MLRKGLQLKTTALLVSFLWLVKSLKNLKMIGFPISSVVAGRLDQLQIELVGLLIGLGLLEL